MTLRYLCAVVGAVAIAGCGSTTHERATHSVARVGGTSGTATGAAARADAICERLNSEFAAAKPIKTMSDLARSVPHRAEVERRVVDELTALARSAGRVQGLGRVISYRKTLADSLAELGAQAKRNDAAAVLALGKSKARLHRELRRAAHAAGLEECGNTGPA
jgi:hypothetical protein